MYEEEMTVTECYNSKQYDSNCTIKKSLYKSRTNAFLALTVSVTGHYEKNKRPLKQYNWK